MQQGMKLVSFKQLGCKCLSLVTKIAFISIFFRKIEIKSILSDTERITGSGLTQTVK